MLVAFGEPFPLKGPLPTSSLPSHSQEAGGGRCRGDLSTTSSTFLNWKKQVKLPERTIINFLKTLSFKMEIILITVIEIGRGQVKEF